MGSGALSNGGLDGGGTGGGSAAGRDAALRAVAAATVAFAVVVLSSQSTGCGTDPQRPDGGTPCQQGDGTCPAGTRCTNRNCVPTCQGGQACPAGMYCESPQSPIAVCSPIQPFACRDSNDCPPPEVCTQGLCLSLEKRADGGTIGCVISGTNNDGCDQGAICYQDRSTGQILNQCRGLPHCSPTGFCPIGFLGSTCNQLPDGGLLYANKERLCLFNICVDTSNCPQGSSCFHTDRSNLQGRCQLGQVGDLCYIADDCTSATYCQYDGGVDDGGVLGQCVR